MNYFSYTISLPKAFWIVWLMAFVLGCFSPNPMQTSLSLLAIPFLMKLLWIKDALPILFFAAFLQWLSIVIKVFIANFQGITFNNPELHLFPNEIDRAFYMSLGACCCFAIGMSVAIRYIKKKEDVLSVLMTYDTYRCLMGYVFFSFFVYGLSFVVWKWPGFQQVFVQIINFKWAFFILLSMLVFLKNQHKNLFLMMVLIEIAISMSGYFSYFKTYLILILLVFVSLKIKWNWKRILSIIVVMVSSVHLLILWTAIKPEYRRYLSQGERAQVVSVKTQDALMTLWGLFQDINMEKYLFAMQALSDRISYIDFFSRSLEYVPYYHPHENGNILKTSMKHIFMPRMFFPDKEIIDESNELNLYTGLSMSNAEQGTSFSLGYIGQWYVDLGPEWMFVAIVLYGFLIGLLYYILVQQSPNIVFGMAVATPLLFLVGFVEGSIRKSLGGSVSYFLIALICLKCFSSWVHRRLKH